MSYWVPATGQLVLILDEYREVAVSSSRMMDTAILALKSASEINSLQTEVIKLQSSRIASLEQQLEQALLMTVPDNEGSTL